MVKWSLWSLRQLQQLAKGAGSASFSEQDPDDPRSEQAWEWTDKCRVLFPCFRWSTASFDVHSYHGICEWRSAGLTFRSRFTTRAGCSKIKRRPPWPSCFAVWERAVNIIRVYVCHCLYVFLERTCNIIIHYDIIYKLSLSHSAGANLRNIIVEYQHFCIPHNHCFSNLNPMPAHGWASTGASFLWRLKTVVCQVSNLFASTQNVWMLMMLSRLCQELRAT
jgi:hypothetical protein